MSLDLGLAIHHAKEAKAWVEEARDLVVATKDETIESVVEAEERIKVLHRELRDTHR